MAQYEFSRVYEIFRGAKKLEAEVRAAYLEAACEGDDSVRSEVESLLERLDDETNTDSLVGAVVADAITSSVPERIDDFRLDGVLGAGGMGVVYRAVQDRPQRTVAMKVLHHGTGEKLVARFQKESEALGKLRHRGIAQIYSAGAIETATGPLSYFVMELVDGPELTTYCEANQLEADQILELATAICEAVEHAHGEGVIHRDLKPGNILVDRDGTPKVLDFGVARVVDDVTVTEAGVVVGTMSYMSPEQAASRMAAIGPWSDVYSIGVMLYEMLAGRRPIELHGLSTPEALSLIATAEPVALERLDPRLAGDISVIVGKALAKEPERRYQSAQDLADDIRRYLNHEPIIARPPTARYQMAKFVRRHRLAVAIAAILAIALPVVAGLGGFVWARLPDLRAHEATLAARALEDELEIAFHDFHQERRQEAAERFARILRDHPDSIEAYAGEVFARFALKEDETVLAMVAEGERRFESDGALTKIKADVFRRAGDAEEARRIAQRASPPTEAAEWFIEGYRNILQARAAGQRTLDGQRFFRSAEENLLRSIAASDAPRRAYYFALAEAIGNQTEVRTKLDFHKVLITRWPESDRAWWWAAYVATNLEDELAIEYYEEFLRRNPDDMEVHSNLGVVLRNLGKDDEAERWYRRAIEIDPTHFSPRFNLGRLVESRGDYEEAAKIYAKVAEHHPLNGRPYLALASTHHKLNRLEEALEFARKAVELDPRIIDSHQNRGIIAKDLGKYTEAIAALREAVKLDPTRAYTHFVLSEVFRACGRFSDCIASLELAVELDPTDAMGQSQLAATYYEQRDWHKAERTARKAIDCDPNYPPAHYNLGAALSMQGRTKEALACFKKCLELDPNHEQAITQVPAHAERLAQEEAAAKAPPPEGESDEIPSTVEETMKRGARLVRRRKFSEAVTCYRRATKLAPKNVQAHFLLAHCLRKTREYEDALVAYDAALALDPNHLQCGYERASLFTAMKRPRESADAYREMIRRHPTHAESHCNLGSTLRYFGDFEGSLAMYEKGHELGSKQKDWKYPSANWVESAVLVLVRNLASRDKLEEAVEILEKYEKLLPDHPNLGRERQKIEKDL